ncbi:MAG: DNA modification methylase [Candidatus Levybacteria bacterium]|nr:DNA modification methylase [Candidatus Levybacteria bacterium]
MPSKIKLAWYTMRRRIDDLIPFKGNPRKLDERQQAALVKSLKRFNLAEIPVCDLDNTILAGHARLRVMQILGRGQEEVDVRIPSRKLNDKERKAYLLTSNAVRGSWDYDLLKEFDTELILGIGFNDDELSNLWNDSLQVDDDEFNEEKEAARIKKPKSKVGEIYALGPHRLAVGNANDPAVLKKLFGNELASMVYSDPVYNLNFPYRTGFGGKQDYGADVEDNRSPDEYRTFLKKSMENALAVSKPDMHMFYWNDQSQIGLVQDLFEELGLKNRRVCLWIKNGQNPTPGIAFSKAYEPCIYSTRGKPLIAKGLENLNEVFNREIGTGNRLIEDIIDLFDIWLVKRLPGSEYTHATSKPPQLHEKAIRRCTRAGDIILDSFLGSGSTLAAAEQLKRRVFGVELEPLFADLTILRYEQLTHNKARRIN